MNVARSTIKNNLTTLLASFYYQRVLPCVAVRHIRVSWVHRNIKDVKVIDNHITRVTWDDNETCDYPHIFLRDNCQCSTCFHPYSKQRLLDTVKNINVDIQPKDIYYNESTGDVSVTWPDKHVSLFSSKWLKERKFPKEGDKISSTVFKNIRTIKWTSQYMKENMPYINYQDLMKDDKTLVQHVENLLTTGLSIVKAAPAESGVLHKITERMTYGYIQKTHYGEVMTIKSKPSPSNVAFTAGYLQLHTDVPYLEYQPGLQLLHCIEQCDGEDSGVNHFTDGFMAAEKLNERHSNYFDLLSKVKFKFNDEGSDLYGKFNVQTERPVIGLDAFGEVQSIAHNNHVRSSFVNASSNTVYESYKAHYEFTRILYSDIFEYKMEPGDIMIFNNKRILHGRTSFDPTTTTRWLEGCYFNWDEVASIYRVAKARIDENE